MIEFENRITVQRPIDEVFAFVSVFENVPKWNYYVRDVTKTSAGPIEVGTTYHQVRKTDQQDFRVVEFEPGKEVTVKTIPPSSPAFEIRFTFQPEERGTQILDEWKLDMGKPKLVECLAAGTVKRAVLENLEKLKRLLETVCSPKTAGSCSSS
jgi:uncharacterized membrane protein